MPFFFADDPADQARIATAASPDAYESGWLNVKYVASEFPLDAPGLTLVRTFGRTHVYENRLARPRAWMASRPAEVQEWFPNRIVVRTEGPGMLVLSEVVDPGWEARVDGVATPLEPALRILRAVRVGAGTHEVTFEFRPRSVYAGGLITLLGVILLRFSVKHE